MSRNDHVLTIINFLELHVGGYKDLSKFENDMYELFYEAMGDVIEEYFPNGYDDDEETE